MSEFEAQWTNGTFPGWMVSAKQNISVSVIIICLCIVVDLLAFIVNRWAIILSFLVKGNTIGYQYCFGNSIKMFFSHYLQKDASSALAHSGAHLDLSAFSSPEVSG